MSSQKLWQYVHNIYGEELGLTSADNDYVSPYSDEASSSASMVQEGSLDVSTFSSPCEYLMQQPVMHGKIMFGDSFNFSPKNHFVMVTTLVFCKQFQYTFTLTKKKDLPW